MQELIPVNIVIGDRTYRVKIHPNDESDLRNTVKIINDKIVEFKTNFGGKDMQDYISMVLVWFATQRIEKGDATSANANIDATGVLAEVDQMLNQLLNNR